MPVQHRALGAPGVVAGFPYHGSGARVRWSRLASTLAVLTGVTAGGCSMSFPLSSLLPESEPAAAETPLPGAGNQGDITGSIPASTPLAQSKADMSKADWEFATEALREALAGNEDAVSIPWQNPNSGARGTVTPVASAYLEDGFACRNFLASHLRDGREAWFEGTACRIHRGQWAIRSTRPLQKS